MKSLYHFKLLSYIFGHGGHVPLTAGLFFLGTVASVDCEK